MKNLIVFITGASSGIGFSTAEFLFENGYTVIGTSRNPDKYSNYKFPLIYMDLTNEKSISKAVKLVYDKYKSIDVLINNAGVSMAAPAEETDLDMLNELMKTNFYGPINVIKHVLKIMRLKNSGKIINISSIASDNGLPFRSIYSASKAAINRFSESLRLELLNTNIHCTVLSPGSIKTSIASNRLYAKVSKNSPYFSSYTDAVSDMNKHILKGVEPEKVSKKIEKLIIEKKPRPHYKVGPMLEKLSSIIKFLLPQKWYEKLLASHYNLK